MKADGIWGNIFRLERRRNVLVLVIGGELLGVLGLLIAIPVATSMKVIVQEFYHHYQIQVR